MRVFSLVGIILLKEVTTYGSHYSLGADDEHGAFRDEMNRLLEDFFGETAEGGARGPK